MDTEILINAKQVTHNGLGDCYEFVLNHRLEIIECVFIESLHEEVAKKIIEPHKALHQLLFELKHVRVNPHLDNQVIIHNLTEQLINIGVNVYNPPHHNDLAMCFKPLGEISDNVRFYLAGDKVIFLSPATAKLKLVSQMAL